MGALVEIDDFPMIWAWFEEDDLLSRMGMPRLHSDENGYFSGNHHWHVLIERISLEYHKLQRDLPAGSPPVTVLIEFARGKEHGGFREAFSHLSDEILQKAAVLYIDVSYSESLRKNRRRYNPDRPDSILEHGLADEKMERIYHDVDWQEWAGEAGSGTLTVGQHQVPFAVFPNEDDVTTPGGEALAARLQDKLALLWEQIQDQQGK